MILKKMTVWSKFIKKTTCSTTFFQNTTYAFQVRGQDSNGNPVVLSKADIKWSLNLATGVAAAKNNCSIDKKGVFTAGTLPGIITVEASLGANCSNSAW